MVGVSGTHLAPEPRAPDAPRDALSPRARQVLDAVPAAASAPATSIARVAGLGVAEVRRLLLAFAEDGLVHSSPTGWRLTARGRG